MTRLIGFLFLASAANASQVATVDLTAPKRTAEPAQITVSGRGGGLLEHGDPASSRAAPDALPLRLRIKGVLPVERGQEVIEVEMTNVGTGPITVPIGSDPARDLNTSQKERRYFEFVVRMKASASSVTIGSAESASNESDPSSRAVMQPGDSVIFKLPAILGVPRTEIGGSPEIRVSVSLFRKDMEGGTDWDTGVGVRIDSENAVPLP